MTIEKDFLTQMAELQSKLGLIDEEEEEERKRIAEWLDSPDDTPDPRAEI